jgi:23S rRNA (adenine2503-C2)-methyltransferase
MLATRPLLAWPPRALAKALRGQLRPAQADGAVRALWQTARELGETPSGGQRPLLGRAAADAVARLVVDRPGLHLGQVASSADGTRKLLLRTHDGHAIETVIIPASGGDRTTVCVSSQVGCGRRCAFCATGALGLTRNLGADEIVDQVRHAIAVWDGTPAISNVVFMGMGEPLDNLEAVADAVEILCDDWAFGLPARRITVSTVGVAHRLPEFFARCRANLALSLNAPDDRRRSAIMPVNERCDLAGLKSALLAHLPPRREVLVEYILFADVNDADSDAELLRGWLDGLPARLNLIPCNPGPDPRLRAPSAEAVRRFQKRLLDAGVRCMVRWPHGRDIAGACGQLAAQAAARLGRGQSA